MITDDPTENHLNKVGEEEQISRDDTADTYSKIEVKGFG